MLKGGTSSPPRCSCAGPEWCVDRWRSDVLVHRTIGASSPIIISIGLSPANTPTKPQFDGALKDVQRFETTLQGLKIGHLDSQEPLMELSASKAGDEIR
jgi:hypothetical protein